MKAVVQRVSEASVHVGVNRVGACGKGLLVLAAAHRDDSAVEAAKMADKVWGLRIFNDEEGKMNLSLKDLSADEKVAVLAVSNFTIYGETTKNRRPSFIEAASFAAGEELFETFVRELRGLGCNVGTGVFGADMKVSLINDGPVTVILDVAPKPRGDRREP